MVAPFVGRAGVVWLAHELVQELAEQLPALLLLLQTQAVPQLGLVLVHKQESWLLGPRTAFRQLHGVALLWM
jgi:hypothetical protein